MSDVFLKDSSEHMLRLYAMVSWLTQNMEKRKLLVNSQIDYERLFTILLTLNLTERAEEMILKDRFLTQLAPDICCKLLKQAYGPNQSLDKLLQLAKTVYYGREYEK